MIFIPRRSVWHSWAVVDVYRRVWRFTSNARSQSLSPLDYRMSRASPGRGSRDRSLRTRFK